MFICFDSSNSVTGAMLAQGYKAYWSESMNDTIYLKDFVAYQVIDEGSDTVRLNHETSQMAGYWIEIAPCLFPQDAELHPCCK